MTLAALLTGIAQALTLAPASLTAIKSLITTLKPTVTNDAGVPLTQEQVLAAIDTAFSTWQSVLDTANAEIGKLTPVGT